jgi:hypothetical protein
MCFVQRKYGLRIKRKLKFWIALHLGYESKKIKCMVIFYRLFGSVSRLPDGGVQALN